MIINCTTFLLEQTKTKTIKSFTRNLQRKFCLNLKWSECILQHPLLDLVLFSLVKRIYKFLPIFYLFVLTRIKPSNSKFNNRCINNRKMKIIRIIIIIIILLHQLIIIIIILVNNHNNNNNKLCKKIILKSKHKY